MCGIKQECLLLICSYVDSKTLLNKISLLSHGTRSLLASNPLISNNRSLKITGPVGFDFFKFVASIVAELTIDYGAFVDTFNREWQCSSVRHLEIKSSSPIDLSSIHFTNLTDLYSEAALRLSPLSVSKLERAIVQDQVALSVILANSQCLKWIEI